MKKNVFKRVPSYENFSFEKTLIEGRLEKSGINVNSVLPPRKKFVLIHKYLETGHTSIVAFSDYLNDLNNVKLSYPHFGSFRHIFVIYSNTSSKRVHGVSLNFIKDTCLINICKNVAEYLAVGEYAMLKKSYFKASSWFEKAKNSASLAAEIIVNY